jgi:hypothetical protein
VDDLRESRGARFDLVAADVPRRTKLALGNKGVVDINLDKIPRHVLGGEDGLVVRGLRAILASALAGEPDTRSAQETIDAWYAGYRNRKSAGQVDALGRGATPKSLSEARARDADAVAMMQAMAVRRTGNDKLAKASRRELRRQLGAKMFGELDAIAKRAMGEPARSSGRTKKG